MYVEFSGTAEAQAQSRRDLLLNSVLAALGIVLLLSVVMGNYRNLLLVLANLPFALVGGVLAGRKSFPWLARRIRNAVRNHAAEFHHADFTL
jgi:Cu/Ag efflux pump CusA